jgi:hypothetical protein
VRKRFVIWAMSNRPAPKLYQWRITRIRSTPAALIGHVEAYVVEHTKQASNKKNRSDQQATDVQSGGGFLGVRFAKWRRC